MAMSKSTILFLCVLVFIAGPVSAAERRVALVIGNSAYANAPLRNPVNDAQDMAIVLRGLGFQVIHKSNVDRKTLRRSFREFRERLHGRVVADNQDHMPSSVQTTGNNPYIQCLLRGSTKPVWHKKQTCLALKGRVVVDGKGKNATISAPRDDHYIRCMLPGQSKPVWHKKTSCLSMGGREVRN